MKSLGRLRGKHQEQRKAWRKEKEKKYHSLQTGNQSKATVTTGSTVAKVKNTHRFRFVSLFKRQVKVGDKIATFLFAYFPDEGECPPDNSSGHSYSEETAFATYRGSEDDVLEPSSPPGDYNGRHTSKPIAPRFQKPQQQVRSLHIF